MKALLDRRLLIVTGKGGTGKTLVSAALARVAAEAGKRVLLVEIDRSGDMASVIGCRELHFEPMEVRPNLHAMVMDTEAALSEYLRLNLKLPLAIRMGPFAKAFDFVATAAPGVREVLTIGKLCWEVKRDNFDLLVVDAPSSGHVIGQLDSPHAIGGLVDSGPLARQTTWMREMLTDPDRMGAVIVTTPEEVPVAETAQLLGELDERTGTPLGAVVVNRTFPQLFTRDEEAVLDALRPQLTESHGALLQAADLAQEMRRGQVHELEALRAAMAGRNAPTLYVPQCFESLEPTKVLDHMTDALRLEVAP